MAALSILSIAACDKTKPFGATSDDASEPKADAAESNYPENIRKIAEKLRIPATEVARIRSLPLAELRRMSKDYINQNHNNGNFYELLAARDLVDDYFIEELLKTDAFTPRGGALGDYDCRANQILQFLDSRSTPDLVQALKEIWQRGNPRDAKIIAANLASVASMDVLEETDALLRSPDKATANLARIGLLRTLRKSVVDEEFRTAIWPASEASFLACKGDLSRSRDASELLVVLNKDKACQFFEDAGVLALNHPLLEAALSQLEAVEAPPEESLLLAILDKTDYANPNTRKRLHSLALMGLAQRKSPQTEARIAEILDSDQRWDDKLGPAAWAARFKLAGISPLAKSAIDAYFERDHNLESLSETERWVCLISFSDSEFSNGGATQWFENHHGGHTSETLEALRFFGMERHAEIMKAINAILAPKGSVKDYDERQKLLEKLTDPDTDKLDRLVDQWYKLPEWEIFVHEWDWSQNQNRQIKQLPSSDPDSQPAR